MNTPSIIAIIPARYASSRLPGKPLRTIAGKTLIERVTEQLYLIDAIDHIIVATDDERILDYCTRLNGVEAVMTSSNHRSGTDRCAEAAQAFRPNDIVLNVQGDEPFISPIALSDLIDFHRTESWDVSTLVVPLSGDRAGDSHLVKVVFNKTGRAFYFSRSPIPFYREEQTGEYHKHLGVYAFKNKILQELAGLSSSRLEKAERLEQLRWMEHDYSVGVLITDQDSIGIDTEEDIERAEQLISRNKS